MAILTEIDRQRIWRGLMRLASRERQEIGLTKSELKAAIDGVDDWLDANAPSLNAAIPQPARSALTLEQKALLLLVVVGMRFNPDALKRLVGEVD